MNFNNILEKIKCYKLKDNDHIVKEPIQLSCGHSICKKCFLIENRLTMNCAKCDEVTHIINPDNEYAPIKLLIQTVLADLFQLIKTETTEKLNILMSK